MSTIGPAPALPAVPPTAAKPPWGAPPRGAPPCPAPPCPAPPCPAPPRGAPPCGAPPPGAPPAGAPPRGAPPLPVTPPWVGPPDAPARSWYSESSRGSVRPPHPIREARTAATAAEASPRSIVLARVPGFQSCASPRRAHGGAFFCTHLGPEVRGLTAQHDAAFRPRSGFLAIPWQIWRIRRFQSGIVPFGRGKCEGSPAFAEQMEFRCPPQTR